MVAAQVGHADVCLELIDSGAHLHQQMKVYTSDRPFKYLVLLREKIIPENKWLSLIIE